MAIAILTVGVSGCGKSTICKKLFSSTVYNHLERDAIRIELMGGINNFCWEKWDFNRESEVTEIYQKKLHSIIERNENMCLSDTWLNPKFRTEMIQHLKDAGYAIKVMFIDTPVEECLERNRKRGNLMVKEKIILKMKGYAQQYNVIKEEESEQYGYELL